MEQASAQLKTEESIQADEIQMSNEQKPFKLRIKYSDIRKLKYGHG